MRVLNSLFIAAMFSTSLMAHAEILPEAQVGIKIPLAKNRLLAP